MIKNDQVYLEHILEAIVKIENFTNEISGFDFDRNVMIQDIIIDLNPSGLTSLYKK
jgi:uncharacterized protein with HEPN domain